MDDRGALRPAIVATVAVGVILSIGLAGVISGAGITDDGNLQQMGNNGGTPTVIIEDETTTVGGTTTVRVSLTHAPDGLGGFRIQFSLVDGAKATITGASANSDLNEFESTIGSGGDEVIVSASDIFDNFEAGATDITLFTVEIQGDQTGTTSMTADVERTTPTVLQLIDDNGDQITEDVQDGSLTVQ